MYASTMMARRKFWTRKKQIAMKISTYTWSSRSTYQSSGRFPSTMSSKVPSVFPTVENSGRTIPNRQKPMQAKVEEMMATRRKKWRRSSDALYTVPVIMPRRGWTLHDCTIRNIVMKRIQLAKLCMNPSKANSSIISPMSEKNIPFRDSTPSELDHEMLVRPPAILAVFEAVLDFSGMLMTLNATVIKVVTKSARKVSVTEYGGNSQRGSTSSGLGLPCMNFRK
mmetsp:Transcript_18280/g.44105  ORF Transcript_18280/g.44105 Transcript_18280/m.44105 type:complete len:224 (-) Transcript_18280:732-1403(-)